MELSTHLAHRARWTPGRRASTGMTKRRLRADNPDLRVGRVRL